MLRIYLVKSLILSHYIEDKVFAQVEICGH